MPDSIYIVAVTAGLLIILAAYVYQEWAAWDDYRRLSRRAHLNLMKQSGEWFA